MMKFAETLKNGRVRRGVGIVLIIMAFAAGFILRGSKAPSGAAQSAIRNQKSKIELWTCSMHPQFKLPKPGKCPICFMDLIPLDMGEDDPGAGPRELSVSENAAALMEIQTAPVQRKFVSAEVRMVGRVDYDETRVAHITAWVPGRLDRLYVDYTGVPVRKGDHMVYLYSPELLSAQEELLQAVKAAKQLQNSNLSAARTPANATIEVVREKLRLWGLTQKQIAEIEARGKPSDHMTIYAPVGGIVIHKNVNEGMYVQTGARIYTIADLSSVWVLLDAYESDLVWLRYGQAVEFTAESYPGEVFKGTIAFIDPVLNQATRTVKVRVNAANPELKLKPGMFLRAVAKANVASDGKVMNPDLAGKWICPMHPEVVHHSAGACEVCGMPLVRTESLGYVGKKPTPADAPLVIPATAPLITGTRAIVYVSVPGKDRPTYEGREILLGPRAGDYYLVRRGLQEGDQVVTRGNFKLDAELQIRAKPSMMTPQGGGDGGEQAGKAQPAEAPAAPVTDETFRRQLAGVVADYFAMQKSLAEDDLPKAVESARQALKSLAAVDTQRITGSAHEDWMQDAGQLKAILTRLVSADGIEAVRKEFALLSEQMTAMLARFRPLPAKTYQFKCPMVFNNRGAVWLQADDGTRNPYFGKTMLKCGEVVQVIPAGELKEGREHE